MFLLDDTIAALASAAGAAGRGIIRCSGPRVLHVLAQRFQPQEPELWSNSPSARRHSGIWELGSRSQQPGEPATTRLPIVVYLWPNRRSYTGQPQAELHLPGSPPLLDAVLGDLFAAGARPAQPGEFTLRAFLAGRLDLMQAEAVLGVIDAGDTRSLQVALTQLAGGVSLRLTELRTDLLDLLADLEAGLDFTEEGIEFVSREVLVSRLSAARDELQLLLDRASSGARTSSRPRVVLAGPPNAGKSTLFNALVGSESALVSPIAGTTRDYLTAPINWQGASWDLVDTAGCETTEDLILNVAQELRKVQLDQADLVVQCISAVEVRQGESTDISAGCHHQELKPDVQSPERHRELQVATQVDLLSTVPPQFDAGYIWLSAHTGVGLDTLRSEIAKALTLGTASDAGILGSTLARCGDSLERAVRALHRASDLAAAGGGDEFLATDVREALDELGSITGAFYTDDLLDRIFSKFCIGK